MGPPWKEELLSSTYPFLSATGAPGSTLQHLFPCSPVPQDQPAATCPKPCLTLTSLLKSGLAPGLRPPFSQIPSPALKDKLGWAWGGGCWIAA
jgi:hypothetical protein